MLKQLFIACVFVTTVQAEQIRLQAGTLGFDNVLWGNGPIHLEGRDFTFDGFSRSARLNAADCAFPCEPRELMSLYMQVNGLDISGTVTYQGTTYTDLGLDYDGLWLEITGDIRVPREYAESPMTKTANVQVRGGFYHMTPPWLPEEESLTGAGVATVVFVKWEGYEEDWIVDSLTYDISPRRTR